MIDLYKLFTDIVKAKSLQELASIEDKINKSQREQDDKGDEVMPVFESIHDLIHKIVDFLANQYKAKKKDDIFFIAQEVQIPQDTSNKVLQIIKERYKECIDVKKHRDVLTCLFNILKNQDDKEISNIADAYLKRNSSGRVLMITDLFEGDLQ